MFPEERQRRLLEMLRTEGQIRVPEAASRLHTSQSTIRLDLKALEQHAEVLRTHGGAIHAKPNDTPKFELHHVFSDRLTEHQLNKQAIGMVAAALIADHETIMIDGGTTTREVCRSLSTRQNIVIVTNVINTYPDLIGANSNLRVFLAGGEVMRDNMTVVGEEAEATILRFRASRAILGIDAISLAFGATTMDERDAGVKRRMIESSDKLIIVADSSKMNHVSVVPVVLLQNVDTLVTDSHLDPAYRSAIEALGVRVVLAPLD